MRFSESAKSAFKDNNNDFLSVSENTATAYKTGIKQYKAFLKKRRLADNLKSAKVWLKTIGKTKSPATYNLRARAMRFYFEKKHADNPEKLWEVQFLTGKNTSTMLACYTENYFTEEQFHTLMKSMSKRISLICRALFWSGCRITELINIRLKDIKHANPGISSPVSITGKGNKIRTVYIPARLMQDIRQTFKGKKYLFETDKGRQYNRIHIANEVSRQAEKINMKAWPHKFRHSKAMYLKNEKKLTPDQIAKALGHADVSTTLKCYFHGTPSAADQGMED